MIYVHSQRPRFDASYHGYQGTPAGALLRCPGHSAAAPKSSAACPTACRPCRCSDRRQPSQPSGRCLLFFEFRSAGLEANVDTAPQCPRLAAPLRLAPPAHRGRKKAEGTRPTELREDYRPQAGRTAGGAIASQLAGLRGAPPPGAAATVAASDPVGGTSLFDAIDKQLGLKLEAQKRTYPVFVIDHIEEKPTDN